MLTLYVNADTVLHRLHPVTKLAGLVALVLAAFVVDRPDLLLPLGLAVGVLTAAAGGGRVLRRFAPLLLIVLVSATLIWTVGYGKTWGPSREGFAFGLATGVRLATFLVTGLFFLTTTRVEEMAYALGRVGVPYLAGFTLTLAFRLVPVFFDSAMTIVQAQRCRGLELARGGPIVRLRRFVPVLVPVFVGALRRADRMAMALELRGFNSGRPRTVWPRPRPGWSDLVAGLLFTAIMAGYLVTWWRGLGGLATLP